jgi:peroxiredoxin
MHSSDMKFRSYSLTFFFLFIPLVVKSNPVTIKGCDPSYAGKTIILYTYDDQITSVEKELACCMANNEGCFELKFEANRVTYSILHLGIYKTFIFTESGQTYTVTLPPFKEKTPEQQINPYFSEKEVHLKSIGKAKDELNNLIQEFDSLYTPAFNKFAVEAYDIRKNKNPELDSAVNALNEAFKNVDNPYFKSYKTYRLGFLRFLALQHKARNISAAFFQNKEVLYDNPAYMDLFDQLYNKYFVFFGRTEKGKEIYDDINKDKSLSKLMNTLSHDNVLSTDSLKELVILKSLYDEFYSDNFSRSAMLEVLDSLSATTNIKEHKQIAGNIRVKVVKLLKGYPAPAFTLFNQDSTLVSLSDFKGKWVYLGFCSSLSYTCLKEYELIKSLIEKLPGKFEVVTICADENFNVMKEYLKKSGYNWTFLHYANQPDILKEYDIRVFPTYFLIDPDGKMVLSPAPSPAENIEYYLFTEMRARGDI